MSGRLKHRTFRRFVVVSGVTLVTGHLILYWLHSVIGMSPVAANITSTVLNTVLVLVANRRWVWSVDGNISLRQEVLPFGAIATAGLGLSTVFVWAAARLIGEGLWVNAANLAGFGVLWILRFGIIDRYVYPTPIESRAE